MIQIETSVSTHKIQIETSVSTHKIQEFIQKISNLLIGSTKYNFLPDICYELKFDNIDELIEFIKDPTPKRCDVLENYF